jgi:hypothetical protein
MTQNISLALFSTFIRFISFEYFRAHLRSFKNVLSFCYEKSCASVMQNFIIELKFLWVVLYVGK